MPDEHKSPAECLSGVTHLKELQELSEYIERFMDILDDEERIITLDLVKPKPGQDMILVIKKQIEGALNLVNERIKRQGGSPGEGPPIVRQNRDITSDDNVFPSTESRHVNLFSHVWDGSCRPSLGFKSEGFPPIPGRPNPVSPRVLVSTPAMLPTAPKFNVLTEFYCPVHRIKVFEKWGRYSHGIAPEGKRDMDLWDILREVIPLDRAHPTGSDMRLDPLVPGNREHLHQICPVWRGGYPIVAAPEFGLEEQKRLELYTPKAEMHVGVPEEWKVDTKTAKLASERIENGRSGRILDVDLYNAYFGTIFKSRLECPEVFNRPEIRLALAAGAKRREDGFPTIPRYAPAFTLPDDYDRFIPWLLEEVQGHPPTSQEKDNGDGQSSKKSEADTSGSEALKLVGPRLFGNESGKLFRCNVLPGWTLARESNEEDNLTVANQWVIHEMAEADKKVAKGNETCEGDFKVGEGEVKWGKCGGEEPTFEIRNRTVDDHLNYVKKRIEDSNIV